MKNMNSKGMTLVEVLAITIIGAIATLLIIQTLSNLFSNEKQISTTIQVREAADFYLESLSRGLYSLNEKNVCEEINYLKPEEKTKSNSIVHYMVIGNKDEASGTCTNNKIIGFSKADNKDDYFSLYVNDQQLNDAYPNIIISDETMIVKNNNNYQITLVLQYNNQKKTFKKNVHSIPSS